MTVGDTTVVTNVNLVGDAVDIGTVKFQLAGTTTWSNLSTSYRVFDADASTLTLKGTHVTSKLAGTTECNYQVTFVDENGETIVDETGEAVVATFTVTVSQE